MPPAPTSVDERALKAISIPNISEIDALFGTQCFLAEKYQVHKSAAGQMDTRKVFSFAITPHSQSIQLGNLNRFFLAVVLITIDLLVILAHQTAPLKRIHS